MAYKKGDLDSWYQNEKTGEFNNRMTIRRGVKHLGGGFKKEHMAGKVKSAESPHHVNLKKSVLSAKKK